MQSTHDPERHWKPDDREPPAIPPPRFATPEDVIRSLDREVLRLREIHGRCKDQLDALEMELMKHEEYRSPNAYLIVGKIKDTLLERPTAPSPAAPEPPDLPAVVAAIRAQVQERRPNFGKAEVRP
jgi:hypothetical protein